jgi:hypothetical protein
MKSAAFSISLNQRKPSGGKNLTDLWGNIGMISNGAFSPSHVLRNALEACDDFKCATNKLNNQYLTANAYFIITGLKINEAQVITRDH